MNSQTGRTVRITFGADPQAAGPRYVMSVAARLLGMHPQTLRKYERFGLIEPSRSLGRSRLYSDEDIARLKVIRHLVENLGLNLAGVDLTLQLLEGITDLYRTMSGSLAPEQRETFEQCVRKLMEPMGLTEHDFGSLVSNGRR